MYMGDEEMVQISLGGLTQKYDMFQNAVLTRENLPIFINLQSVLMIGENQLQPKSTCLLDICSTHKVAQDVGGGILTRVEELHKNIPDMHKWATKVTLVTKKACCPRCQIAIRRLNGGIAESTGTMNLSAGKR